MLLPVELHLPIALLLLLLLLGFHHRLLLGCLLHLVLTHLLLLLLLVSHYLFIIIPQASHPFNICQTFRSFLQIEQSKQFKKNYIQNSKTSEK